MKKLFKRIVFFAIFVLMAVMLYYNTPYHISKYNWKCKGEGRINDFMVFKDTGKPGNLTLKWPVIYKDGQIAGYVVCCFYDRLWVYSLRDGRDKGFGEYVGK